MSLCTAVTVAEFSLTRYCTFSLIFLAVCLLLVLSARSLLAAKVLGTRIRRVCFSICALAVPQAIAAVLVGNIDFRTAAHTGRIDESTSTTFWAVTVLMTIALCAQALLAYHTDKADSTLQSFAKELDVRQRKVISANMQRDFVLTIEEAFLRVVARRKTILDRAKDFDDPRAALDPDHQLIALIDVGWELFNQMINADGNGTKYRVRVALFAVSNDQSKLVPIHSWNGMHTSCISHIHGASGYFSLKSPENLSAAAAASRTGQHIYVSNASTASHDDLSPFRFFDESERNSIRSLLAIPMHLDGAEAPYNVFVVDTERENYFSETDMDLHFRVKHITNNLAHRLLLEDRLMKLCSGDQYHGKGSDHDCQ